MWLTILFTLVLGYFIYYFCLKPYNYWKNRGIVYEIPLPLVGNFGSAVLKKKRISEINDYLYKKYSKERYVGIYIFTKPALLLRDINLIKKICLDEFDHFPNRVQLFDKKFDSVVGKVLPNLKGEEWERTRQFLNFAFSNSQLKNAFKLTSEYAKNVANHIVKENENLKEILMYDVFSKFESDIISSFGFGITNDSFEHSDNLFYRMHQKLKGFGAFEKMKLSLIQLCPLMAKIFQVHVISASKTDFFKTLITESMKKRQSENIFRPDFVQYLVEAKNGSVKQEKNSANSEGNQERGLTEEEMAIQTFIFLNAHAGMETIVTTSSLLAYELALNPVIQVKLQEEIDNVLQNSRDSTVSYEDILKMEYLDCVISECLRKWPPVYQTDRQCVQNFFEVELSVPDDEKIVIEKGTTVIIPIMAIHRDPKYFPAPERFDPERFNADNVKDIVPGSYIQFGCGPRSCIGSKFSVLEIKLLFFYLLSKFDLVPTEKTHVSKNPSSLDVHSATSTFLGLKTRKVTSL